MIEKEGEGFHHDEGLSTQKTFQLHVLSLVEVINDMGNPFLDQSEDLLTLDTGNVLDESVVDTSQSSLTILALFISQSKRIVSHSLNQNPKPKQSNQKL